MNVGIVSGNSSIYVHLSCFLSICFLNRKCNSVSVNGSSSKSVKTRLNVYPGVKDSILIIDNLTYRRSKCFSENFRFSCNSSDNGSWFGSFMFDNNSRFKSDCFCFTLLSFRLSRLSPVVKCLLFMSSDLIYFFG